MTTALHSTHEVVGNEILRGSPKLFSAVPRRFEDEYPDAAAFLQLLYREPPQYFWGGRKRFLPAAIHARPQAGVDGMPNRNDPCLCGSGKKFKKCCLR